LIPGPGLPPSPLRWGLRCGQGVLLVAAKAREMSEQDLIRLLERHPAASARVRLARWVESAPVQRFIIGVILLNGLILGLETSATLMERIGALLLILDKLCLAVFLVEIAVKLFAYRGLFWRSGWNWFDFFVVAIALAPGAGPWAVLRSLRILRVLRLLTVMPQLRKVVAAFVHSIPGLSGVMVVMVVFFYTMGVLATNLFGPTFPHWFGTLGASLYSLFQVMTLESWSMGIVRPVMEVHPWAWAFFVPFIVIATFTILNLFIGIIVSTMQELSTLPNPEAAVSRHERGREGIAGAS
jgi:voltage-gated sodium channel